MIIILQDGRSLVALWWLQPPATCCFLVQRSVSRSVTLLLLLKLQECCLLLLVCVIFITQTPGLSAMTRGVWIIERFHCTFEVYHKKSLLMLGCLFVIFVVFPHPSRSEVTLHSGMADCVCLYMLCNCFTSYSGPFYREKETNSMRKVGVFVLFGISIYWYLTGGHLLLGYHVHIEG